jgi:hypothetical protein
MQINFYTSPTDEKCVLDFIEKKGGYFVGEFWKPELDEIEILSREKMNNYENREVGILNNEILTIDSPIIPLSKIRDKRGNTIVEIIEFTRSYSDGNKLHHGRLWINGLKPETERLYKSISSFIRRNFIKDGDWYFGKDVNDYCIKNNLSKGA